MFLKTYRLNQDIKFQCGWKYNLLATGTIPFPERYSDYDHSKEEEIEAERSQMFPM